MSELTTGPKNASETVWARNILCVIRGELPPLGWKNRSCRKLDSVLEAQPAKRNMSSVCAQVKITHTLHSAPFARGRMQCLHVEV